MAKTFGRSSSFFIIFYGLFLWEREKHKNPYEHLTLPACHAVCYEPTSTLGKQKGFIDFTFLHFNFLIIINGVTEKNCQGKNQFNGSLGLPCVVLSISCLTARDALCQSYFM